MKNNKGITLISLSITIFILLLLSSTLIISTRGAYSVVKTQDFISKMKIIQARVDNIAEEDNFVFPTELKMNSTNEFYSDFNNIINDLKDDQNKTSWVSSPEEISDEEITNYYCFTPRDLNEKLGIKDVNSTVIINFATRNVIALKGVKIDEKTYYRQCDIDS